MTDQELFNAIADAVTQANFQFYQAVQQAPKALVMEEPRGPSQLIEVIVRENGTSSVNFPEIQNLKSTPNRIIVLKALRLITPSVLPIAPISGLANAPLAELQKVSLIMYSEEWIKGQNIPALTLNDMFTEGSSEPYRREKMRFNDWKMVDWTKSSIAYANGTPSANAPYAFVFDAEYLKLNQRGLEITGPG